MKQEEGIKQTPPVYSARGIVRGLVYLLMAPMVFQETGIVTTILLGMLHIEVAIKGDWLHTTNNLLRDLGKSFDGVLASQNAFNTVKRKEEVKDKEVNENTKRYRRD